MPDPFAVIDAAGSSPSLLTGEPNPAKDDKFAFIDSGGAPLDRSTVAVRQGIVKDPARAGRILRLRDRTGMPSDFLDRNLDEVEKITAAQDFDPGRFRRESPLVAGWMAQSPEHAALAREDLPVLAALERFVSESPDYRWSPDGRIEQSPDPKSPGYGNSFTPAELLRDLRQRSEGEAIDSLQREDEARRLQGRFGPMANIVVGMAGSIAQSQAALGTQTPSGRAAYEDLAQAGAELSPGLWGDIQRGTGGVIADIPLMIAGGVTMKAATALMQLKRAQAVLGMLPRFTPAVVKTGALVQPLAIREGLATGREHGWANGLTAWGIETAIPSAFGPTGAERAVSKLVASGLAKEAAPGFVRASLGLLKQVGLEATEESVTELAHALHESASGIDPQALDPERLWRRMAAAGAVGGIAGGGFNLPEAVSRMVGRPTPHGTTQQLAQIDAAMRTASTIEMMTQAAAKSVAAGSNEAAAKTLWQTVADKRLARVYIDQEDLARITTAKGMDPRAVAIEIMAGPPLAAGGRADPRTSKTWDQAAQTYDDAVRTGSAIPVKSADLAFWLAKHEQIADELTKQVRMDPSAKNMREVDEEIAALEQIQDDPGKPVGKTAKQETDEIAAEIAGQLQAAGMDEASANASAVQAAVGFRVLAARFNQGRTDNLLTPRQLYNEIGLSVQRQASPLLASPRFESAKLATARSRATAQRQAAQEQMAQMQAEDTAKAQAARAADEALAQAASGDEGARLIDEAIARVRQAGSVAGIGDVMLALGPDFGFRPDAKTAALTSEQERRSAIFLLALRARGADLMALAEEAQVKRDPLANTIAETASRPQVSEQIAAQSLELRDLYNQSADPKSDLTPEQRIIISERGAALAKEVAPYVADLGLEGARLTEIELAVEHFIENDPQAQREYAQYISRKQNLSGQAVQIPPGMTPQEAAAQFKARVQDESQIPTERLTREPVETSPDKAPMSDTIDVDGIQRPTLNSNGQRIAQTEEAVRNFWKWFGDSKVVDAQGRPRVMYHGTNAEFEVFEPGAKGLFGGGIYLAGDPKMADRYGAEVYPLYVRSESPAILNNAPGLSLAEQMKSVPDGTDVIVPVIGRDLVDGIWQMVVRDPTQIKSATGNRGTFDPSNPSILYQSAYHGTGNSQPYDRFDYNRVGGPGGEGAQAYGWGLYFAAKRDVAEWYKEKLTDREYYPGNMINPERNSVAYVLSKIFKDGEIFHIDPETLSEEHIKWLSDNDIYLPAQDEDGNYVDKLSLQNVVDELSLESDKTTDGTKFSVFRDGSRIFVTDNSWDVAGPIEPGKLYTVDIPEDSEMLDWDKPLSEQPEKVRALADRYIQGFPARSTGAELYRDLGEIAQTMPEHQGKRRDQAASDALRAAGIPGIRYLDGGSRNAGDGTHNYVIFDDSRIQIKGFEQRTPRQPIKRGSITFDTANGQRQTIIRLFNQADLSTFLHESGHLYLELLGDLASRPDAPQQIRDDFAAALNFLGVKTREDIGVEAHEKWARGWEAYLMKGQAPSAELRGVFARFSGWLKAIYRSIRSLDVEITPEIQGVMDRLVATDEEIASSNQALGDDGFAAHALAMGIPEERVKAIVESEQAAIQEATDRLRNEAMGEIRRETTAWWSEARARIREEVAAEINAGQGYIAEAALRRNATPDGQPLDTPPVKIDSHDLRRNIDRRFQSKAEQRAAMGRFALMHRTAGGIPLNQAAALFGYQTGDALVDAILGLKPRVAFIDATTDERMRARFGDMMLDGTMTEKAMDTLHTDRLADLHLAKWNALTGSTPSKRRTAPIEVIRLAAQEKIAKTKAGELQPNLYLRAEIKARKEMAAALANRDAKAAEVALQREILNHELYRASMDAKAQVEKTLAFARSFDDRGRRAHIGKAGGWQWTVTKPTGEADTYATEDEARSAAALIPGSTWERTSGFLEQIDAIRHRYGFRDISAAQLSRIKSIAAWASERADEGQPVEIPDFILQQAEKTHWRDLSVEDLAAVADVMGQIQHAAKSVNELSAAQRKQDLADLAGDLIQELETSHPKVKEPPSHDGRSSKMAKAVNEFWLSHIKAARFVRSMDGEQDNGTWWNALIRPFNDAATRKLEMQAEAKDRQDALWTSWRQAVAKEEKGWPAGEVRAFDGWPKGLDRIGAIMVALNWGNEGNRDRLMRGQQVTEGQVQAVLDSLTDADLTLVEGIWDHIDSYWSEIKALEQRVHGLAPEKVEAMPFQTRAGTLKGGYFPIVYSGESAPIRIDGDPATWAQQMLAQAHGTTQTKHGHTKARTGGEGQPLDLSPDVIGRHLNQVIHDLTHREALIDTVKILTRPDVVRSIEQRMGAPVVRQLKDWLGDIATEGQRQSKMAKAVGWLRRGFSMSTMGFRPMTAALQLTGFANAVKRVGPGRMLHAIGNLFSGPEGMGAAFTLAREKSAMMRQRERTQTQEMVEIANDLRQGKLAKAQQWTWKYGFRMMQKVQFTVDAATWIAAYRKAAEEGANEEDAVAIADQTVIDTQSSGLIKDLSAVQRDALGQIFTGAYTYGSLVFNQLQEVGGEFRQDWRQDRLAATGKALYGLGLVIALPALMTTIARSLMRPEDEDRKAKGFGTRYASEILSTILGSMAVVREISGAIQGYDYAGPATTKTIGAIYDLIGQAAQGEIDKGLGKASLDTLGGIFGMPTGQLWATGTGIADLIDNPRFDPRPAIFGPSPKR